MSTHIPTRTPELLSPVTLVDLREYFHASARQRPCWRVGAEFEKFAVWRDTGRPLRYEEPGGINNILASLAGRFGWHAFHEDGHLTTLVRDGATVSLEPGGQIELSTAPAASLDSIALELRRHLDELRTVTDPNRIAFLAAGVLPLTRAEGVALMPRARHAVMARYLAARSPTAHQMMRATASIQATFDYADEGDAGRKFTTALHLGPIVNTLWGNAPLYAGRRTGDVSYRGHVWRGMDPDRSGLLLDLLEGEFSFARWVDYLLDVPMMFTFIDGRYRPAGRRTFRDFLERGEDGYFPTMTDWELQLTAVFPEARLKRFLEVRGADAVPPPLALSVPALWKGLLYDEDALEAAGKLARSIRVAELPRLYETAYRQGLAAEYLGRSLLAWCRELTDLACEGLRRQADANDLPDERGYLDPVWEVLERGRSPGAEFLTNGPVSASPPSEIVDWFSYR